MLFNFNWLKDYLQYNLTPQQAAAWLTAHAFEVKTVAKRGQEVILDIDVLPNRGADGFSHSGIARELNALAAYKGLKPIRGAKPARRLALTGALPKGLSVKVEKGAACQRYSLQLIKKVKVGPSPTWLKTRLKSLGVEPINNVVDIANYVMLDTGQPLHAFDADVLKDAEGNVRLSVQSARGGEVMRALDSKIYKVPAGVLLIRAPGKILALGGIKGAVEGSITKLTTSVILEAANFGKARTYESSAQLGLKTDASVRFSHGLDPALTITGLERAAQLLKTLAGGQPSGRPYDVFPVKPKRVIVALSPAFVVSLAGAAITKAAMKRALLALGFNVARHGQVWRVQVPSHRLDISGPADLAEEIIRFYGYNAIRLISPTAALTGSGDGSAFAREQRLKELLVDRGFDEVMTYALVPAADLKQMGLKDESIKKLALENALSTERAYLRPSLLPSLLRAAVADWHYSAPLRICEFGRVFLPRLAKGGPPVRGHLPMEEQRCGGVILLGADLPRRYPRGAAFFAAKGEVESFLAGIGFKNWQFRPPASPPPFWQTGRVAVIESGGQALGMLGEPAAEIGRPSKIPGRLVLFEFKLAPLLETLAAPRRFKAPARYPSVLRDISLVVSENTPVAAITAIIQEQGGGLLESAALFDWYEGPNVGVGKKSLAFHVTYRSRERTLTDAEVDKRHKVITESLTKELSAVIR